MSDDGSAGWVGLTDSNSEFNRHSFHVRQHLAKVRTATPVKIIAVTGTSPNFIVSVQPLVNQVDGAGNATPHGVIHGIPVTSMSGGNGHVTVKPKVGDQGLMAICDRDISAVKANAGQANPGSRRRHDLADGVYLGGFGNMNGAPPQSVTFDEAGVHIVGAPAVNITGNLTVTGTITAGFGTGDAVTLQQHKHAGGPVPDAGT
jgi:hypothetical protein